MFDVLYEHIASNLRGKNVRERCFVGAFFPSSNLAFYLSLPLAGVSSLQLSTVC
jgi:hypothetical protein